MRKQPDWFAKWDDRILEYLYEFGRSTPSQIADDKYIRVSSSYVSQRLKELVEHDLVESKGGEYKITKKGTYYLAGGYDPEMEEYVHEVDPERGIYNYERMGVFMRELVDRARSKWNRQ